MSNVSFLVKKAYNYYIVQDIQNKTDNELVVLIRQNPEYLSYIIDRYKGKLTKYIRRRTNINLQDIEDVLQDIFIKIYININEYDERLVFSSWIYRIAHNYMIDWFRKNKKHMSNLSIDDEENKLIHLLEDKDQRIDDKYDSFDKELLDIIKKELNNISEEYKEIILLKFFEDKSYEEISDILKISTNSVGVKINRAKKILKQKIHI